MKYLLLVLYARGLVPALVLLLNLTATPSLRAQDSTKVPLEVNVDGDMYFVLDQQPTLLPNPEAAMQQLQAQIQYPDSARRAGIEGRVIVQFVVNEEGNVEDAKVLQGIDTALDEEALRAVHTLKFTPGRLRGKAVGVQVAIPITFQISDNPAHPEGTAQKIRFRTEPGGIVIIESQDMTASEFAETLREGIREAESGAQTQAVFIFREALKQAESGATTARVKVVE